MSGLNVQDIDAITLGLGVLEMGGVNLGQLKETVELQPKTEFLDFKAGVPRQLVKRFLLEEGATIKASLAELSAQNYAVLSNNATEETITAGVSAEQTKSAVLVGTRLWVSLEHKDIADGANVPVVKNQAGTTTYTEDEDYIIDYVNGAIRRAVGSTITDGQTVVVTFKYNTSAAKRYSVGGKTALTDLPMTFTHLKPNGKYVKVVFHRAALESGFPLKFTEDKVTMQEVTITALADTTKATGKQLYYVEFET